MAEDNANATLEESSLPSTYLDGFHDIERVRRMPYRELWKGQRDRFMVSCLSLGTSAFGDVFSPCTQESVNEIVLDAVKGGVNLIDTAYWYGHGKSEERLGKALIGIPRTAYYLQSKCCRYEAQVDKMFDFSYERTLRAVDESLKRLGVDYLDCMQVHDPEFAPSIDIILEETLPALQKAKEEGKIKHIGLTGYPLAIHRDIISRSKVHIDSCLFYCHYSLNDSSLLSSGIIEFLESKGICVINAAPMSMGLLTSGGPQPWHPAPSRVKEACSQAAAECTARGVNLSRLALEFSLGETRIPTTLVSTMDPELARANLNAAYSLGKLTETEARALQYCQEEIFAPLNNESWEGVQPSQYKALLERLKAGEVNVGTISTN